MDVVTVSPTSNSPRKETRVRKSVRGSPPGTIFRPFFHDSMEYKLQSSLRFKSTKGFKLEVFK